MQNGTGDLLTIVIGVNQGKRKKKEVRLSRGKREVVQKIQESPLNQGELIQLF